MIGRVCSYNVQYSVHVRFKLVSNEDPRMCMSIHFCIDANSATETRSTISYPL